MLHRRHFLKNTAATLALTALHAQGFGAFLEDKPYRVALIGTGWYGKSDLFRLMQVAPVQVVALCDPDQNQLNGAAALLAQRQPSGKAPRLYGDFRKLLAENELDIVLIATPDHWHALTAIEAVKRGAHVYVQKPISVDVLEGEAMLAAARQYKRVVQVGMQRRSTPHFVEAKKNIIDAGKLGKVAHVDMYCYYHMRNKGNPQTQPVPAGFDYEMWTGPAPMRPFDGLPHIGWWRAFMEYGNGIVGDMCVHMLDAARWLLGLGWPKQITSQGGILMDKTAKSNISDTQTAVFAFDGLNCTWQHRSWGSPVDPEYPWGLTIYGDKGTLRMSTLKYD
ncbi:MAG TPA: Gfo/Idh/MocA family oxidoreductase, partial [Chitinophagaceae bacterium]|nr:Gfo/Idh/MocA family oxidoreductase [Chitinophagaceae bacterium]